MKILIIEDDQRVAELIIRGLEEQDYETDFAYDGLLGKKLALQNHKDLKTQDPKSKFQTPIKNSKLSKPNKPITNFLLF